MAESTRGPDSRPVSYFFQLQGMEPRTRYDNRSDSRDRWVPPKRKKSNILYTMPGQGDPLTLTYFHNGERTVLLNAQQVIALRGRTEHYKTYSMYHARSVLWTVDYDATKHRVGDGEHENAEDDSDEEMDSEDDGEEDESSDDSQSYGDDWAELSFCAANIDGFPSLSRAGRRLRERRMLARGHGQEWARHLLPDRYQARGATTNRRIGGLVGDIPLLIGLAAMSLPVRRWLDILPQTIVNPPESTRSWRVSQAQIDEVERGSQWDEKRGVVVKVFRDIQHTSSAEYLGQYEQGIWGPILA